MYLYIEITLTIHTAVRHNVCYGQKKFGLSDPNEIVKWISGMSLSQNDLEFLFMTFTFNDTSFKLIKLIATEKCRS